MQINSLQLLQLISRCQILHLVPACLSKNQHPNNAFQHILHVTSVFVYKFNSFSILRTILTFRGCTFSQLANTVSYSLNLLLAWWNCSHIKPNISNTLMWESLNTEKRRQPSKYGCYLPNSLKNNST